MPSAGGYYYRLFPELGTAPNSFRVDLVPPGASEPQFFHLKIDQQINPAMGLGVKSPEAIATGCYPYAKQFVERMISDGLQQRLQGDQTVRHEDVTDLQLTGGMSAQEKVRVYMAISNMNPFADPNVPISTRILSEEMEIPEQQIRQMVGSGEIPGLKLVAEKFVRPVQNLEV